MDYNSQKDLLIIPEYGRNIQALIEFNKTIEDDKERQEFAEQVVNLMQQMNPQSKNLAEYRNKLWNHFFRIAQYDINVVPPTGEKPSGEDAKAKPATVEYPVKEKEYRHYGHHVRTLITKAITMEDGPIKEGFVENIASFMKLAYKNWNPEHYVSDEIILADLKVLSDGKLNVSESSSLDLLTSAVRKKRRPSNTHKRNNNRKRRRY
ncbi:MAG: DUF4290 domain-containing protein [Saprospiraceae bacterium]|nr:DUF4290 domain-containing protein [Bacteroidia bacterium]NNF20491.1 DUF4290 domain-containing protein [Saprospiraceae bacterium]